MTMVGTATSPAFGAIVLAGGRAARLGGADKPGLVVGGRTLLGSVLSAAAAAGARRAVVVGPDRADLAHDVPTPGATAGGTRTIAATRGDSDGDEWLRFVREEPPGAGPVPALRRGLAEVAVAWPSARPAGPATAGEPWVLVLAADLPFLRAGHLRTLLQTAGGHAGAVLVDDSGQPQWLTGCWRTEVLRRAAARYRHASLRGLLAPLDPALVTIRPAAGEPPPWVDCDTPEDVRRAGQWQAGTGRAAVDAARPTVGPLRRPGRGRGRIDG